MFVFAQLKTYRCTVDQIFVHVVMQGCFYLFILAVNKHLPKVPLLDLYMRYQGLALTCPHRHVHCRHLFSHDTMCYDWQIDWPADWGCGATWQVEIGKWEEHFSLLSTEQKIKAVSSSEGNRKRWSTRCPSG